MWLDTTVVLYDVVLRGNGNPTPPRLWLTAASLIAVANETGGAIRSYCGMFLTDATVPGKRS
jgi:hypothetical protein